MGLQPKGKFVLRSITYLFADSRHNIFDWPGRVDNTRPDVFFEPADRSTENSTHVGQSADGELNLVSRKSGESQVEHKKHKKHRCKFCSKEYVTKRHYETHLKLHKGKGGLSM